MLIFTPYQCPRFRYACEILFENYLGNMELTSDSDYFNQYSDEKIEYNSSRISEGVLFIPSHEQLWNKRIEKHEIKLNTWKDLPALYAAEGDIPFDIFSAVFFLITRYEEYLPYDADRMSRFPASESFAFKNGFLRKPLIDLWRKAFEEELKSRWPQIKFNQRAFSFLSTIDVDSAFAYKHKGLKRTLGGMARDVLRLDFSNLFHRIKTLTGAKEDVYETYDYIALQCARYDVSNTYFFLLADFSQYDKNVPHTSVPLQQLIKRLAKNNKVGIHPGVASNASAQTLEKEKKRLEQITQTTCVTARQHYLMLFFPDTYRAYLNAGIKQDYTMGYADDAGFRASTSRPFYWFDLEKNEKTNLLVFPFAAMDTTLKNYQKLSIEQAIDLTREMMKDVYATGGNFIALWHNETLSDAHGWQGWRKVWEATLEQSAKKNELGIEI